MTACATGGRRARSRGSKRRFWPYAGRGSAPLFGRRHLAPRRRRLVRSPRRSAPRCGDAPTSTRATCGRILFLDASSPFAFPMCRCTRQGVAGAAGTPDYLGIDRARFWRLRESSLGAFLKVSAKTTPGAACAAWFGGGWWTAPRPSAERCKWRGRWWCRLRRSCATVWLRRAPVTPPTLASVRFWAFAAVRRCAAGTSSRARHPGSGSLQQVPWNAAHDKP